MRCIWSTTASNAFHVLAGRGPALSYGRAAFSRVARRSSRPNGQTVYPTVVRVSTTSAALSCFHNVATESISVQDAVDAIPESSTSLPNLLKPSQVAFAAAQAIRMCVGNSGIADGFFVLNSLRFAAYRAKASALPFKMPGMLYSKAEFEAAALQFGPNVPQRLPAHALLHGLIRSGLAEPAFQLSKMMMAEGVVIRSATLEAVVKSLVYLQAPRPRQRTSSATSPSPAIPLKLASEVLMLRPSIMADQRSRFALQLLFLARRHRQRRTDTMFKLIMAASLLNGELIIFSLLFGWTCREWQTAYSLECNLTAITEDDELQSSSQVIAARSRWAHLRMEALRPDSESLQSGLSFISTILARHSEKSAPTHERLVALQALGNLAGLLDRRQIPFSQIASLLRTMYKCPRVEDEIWIVGAGGCPERIKAYEYFHRVLAGLIDTLPTENPRLLRPSVARDAMVESRQYRVLPPLGLYEYNALLHYALRHRLSPALGKKVLSHMMEKRWIPLTPDKATADILLRSGTLLRRYDIVVKALGSMGTVTFPLSDKGIHQPDAVIHSGPVAPVRSPLQMVADNTSWGRKLRRISTQQIEVPDLPSQANNYILTSYIAYLTAIGQPHAVKDLLFAVIPELDRRRPHRKNGALRRAIVLGPVFLTAVLNALSKSTQPGLTDRIWHLAKKAERYSWKRLVPDCKPWIFGPEVYTVMVRFYSNLFKREKAWILSPNERPVSKIMRRRSRWDRFIYDCQLWKRPGPIPAERVKVLLRRNMQYAAADVFRRLINLRRKHAAVRELREWLPVEDLPMPDSRFFNAALHAFYNPTPPQPTTWYEHRARHEKYLLDQSGPDTSNPGWSARRVVEIADCMLHYGFPIPLGLQHLLVRRLGGVERPGVQRVDHSPFGYREVEHRPFRAFQLSTRKERGLPISSYAYKRRTRRPRRNSWNVIKP